MRHRINGKKLNRNIKQRQALLRNLIKQLLTNGKVETTEAKAKVLKNEAERFLSKAKDGSLASRRALYARLGEKNNADKAIDGLAPQLEGKSGGYIKSIRLGRRIGDNAMMVRLEVPYTVPVVEEPKKETKVKKEAKETKKTRATKKA